MIIDYGGFDRLSPKQKVVYALKQHLGDAWVDEYYESIAEDVADAIGVRFPPEMLTDDGKGECSPACFDDCDGDEDDSHVPAGIYDPSLPY